MAWTDKLIRFPQARRTAAVEDYRAEPAVILVLPVVRVERQRCVEAFDALNEAIRDENLPICPPGFYWVW